MVILMSQRTALGHSVLQFFNLQRVFVRTEWYTKLAEQGGHIVSAIETSMVVIFYVLRGHHDLLL